MTVDDKGSEQGGTYRSTCGWRGFCWGSRRLRVSSDLRRETVTPHKAAKGAQSLDQQCKEAAKEELAERTEVSRRKRLAVFTAGRCEAVRISPRPIRT